MLSLVNESKPASIYIIAEYKKNWTSLISLTNDDLIQIRQILYHCNQTDNKHAL